MSTTIPLSWDGSPEATVTGYKIYAGFLSDVYLDPGSPKDVGNILDDTYTVDETAHSTFFFAVTAYTATDESDFSNEISINLEQPPSGQSLGMLDTNLVAM